MIKQLFSLLLMFVALSPMASAQQTVYHDHPEETLRQAMELFQKEKFGAARTLFLEVMAITDPAHGAHGQATLYAGLSAAALFHPDAEKLLSEFLTEFPDHPGKQLAWFQMGNIKFRAGNHRLSLGWYNRLQPAQINHEQRDEFLFKKGYSLLQTGDTGAARPLFAQVRDPLSDYFLPARYYSGHIAYLSGDYTTALRAFEQLIHDPQYGALVPYYMVHIHFLQEDYQQLLETGSQLLPQATPEKVPEISRLMGEAHFVLGDYQQAIPLLETYFSHTGNRPEREDHYQMGFSYFITGRFQEAIPHLERVTSGNDALAQNAYFHLAYAYVETDQKRFARNAFLQAHQMDFMEDIAGEALFHYAKLSFELSFDPYNEAIIAFQNYIDNYPNSPRIEEAYGYLVDLYLTTRNYRDALRSLDRTTLATPALREAYQRVSHYRGVELFNNGDFAGAIEHFQKSLTQQQNTQITARNKFWSGEAHYRMGNYSAAVTAQNDFLTSPGAFGLNVFPMAHYSLGYAHFKLERYADAIRHFRNFVAQNNLEPRLQNDAILRIADSYFVSKDYPSAMRFYDRAVAMSVIDTDYAVFQKGLVYGIMGDFQPKIQTLQSLISNHPRSSFVADARYEIGNSYMIMDMDAQARQYFGQIISQHPNSSYVQSAMLKTGLIHYNSNRDDEALDMFRQVVEQYPGTPQAQEALSAMQSIYVVLDRVDEFVRYSESRGIASISEAQQDSLTYQAAESRYQQGDCQNAVQSFTNYLDRFPNGIFSLNAQFYRAECHFRSNRYQQSLAGYEFVIERPRSMFTENALLRASAIHHHLGNMENAYILYRQLEEVAEIRSNLLVAREGQMRTLYRLQRYSEALQATAAVLSTDKVSEEAQQEAHLIRGVSAMETGNLTEAQPALGLAAEMLENERAAEAMYRLSLIAFRQGDYEAAEEMIFDHSNRMLAHDYWLAKSFLLLADVYLEKENTFQARTTLESIIENYDGGEILEEARRKLEFIRSLESDENGLPE